MKIEEEKQDDEKEAEEVMFSRFAVGDLVQVFWLCFDGMSRPLIVRIC